MNNKGFTLIELLGVIIILSVIAVIVVPKVDEKVLEGEENLGQIQEKNIKEAAQIWAAKNIYNLPANGESCYIKYSDLVNGGYLQENLEDPNTKVKFTDDNVSIKIKKATKYNKYTYTVKIDNSDSNNKTYCNDISDNE